MSSLKRTIMPALQLRYQAVLVAIVITHDRNIDMINNNNNDNNDIYIYIHTYNNTTTTNNNDDNTTY